MTEPLIKREFQQLTLKRFAASLVLNALINTAIAVLLTAIKFGQGFQNDLIISQCIGFSFLRWSRKASSSGDALQGNEDVTHQRA